MRWWVVLCVAVLWDTASLQPTKEADNGPDRECCPCPKDSAVESTNALETVSLDQAPAASSVARAAGCPCQLRSADAEGAPSAFFPAAVRAIPFVSLDDSKEDPKPLLHPEVDLASSVLDTLREATNEEYEDALAREAARAAQEPDGIAAESAHNPVTVVINPEDASHDDVMSEASHVHEARCINPLGRSSLNLRAPAFDSPDLLSEILRLPKRKPSTFRAWNLFDMDSGASNVNEHVVEPMFKESDVETPKTPSLLRFSTENIKPQSTLALRFPSLLKNTKGRENTDADVAGSILDKLRQSKKVPHKLELSSHISKLIPKLDTSHLRKAGDDDLSLNTNSIDLITDTRNSPSNFKLQIPQISTLIPKIDGSNLVRKTEENGLSRSSDIRDDNRNSASTIIPNISKLIPKIDLSNLQQKSNDDALHSGIRSSEINLKLKVPNLKTTTRNNQIPSDTFDSDSANSASTLQERYTSFAKVNTDDCDLESHTVETNHDLRIPADKSINLNNVENVDIEDNTLNKKIGLNLKVPDLKLAPTKSRDAATDLVNNLLKGLQVPNLRHLISSDIFNLRNNDQATKSTEQKEVVEINPENQFATEILDTVPSPSEPQTNNDNIVEKERENDINNRINEEIQNMIEEMPVKTEILDSIPKSSEISDISDTDDPEFNEDGIDDNDLINAATEQIQKSKDEEVSELVNNIEEMNEDSIDDVIDNINNEEMDRDNNAEDSREDFDAFRGSMDEIERDDFATENKVDGLAINSDIQSLSEKNVPETSFNSNHDALQPLRERLRKKLGSLKLEPKVTMDLPRLNSIDKTPKDQARSESQNKEETTKMQDLEISNENFDQVNLEDLQRMSDSLLNQEKEQKVSDKNTKPEIIDSEPKLNNDVQTDNIVLETNNMNSVHKVDKACIVKDSPNKNTESDMTNDSKNNEMAAGASERVASIADPESPLINVEAPLRQSIILEPISFGSNLNLYNRPVLDLNNLNNPLSPFKIPNLLKASEGSNINLFSSNDGSLEDVQPKVMSAQPSTSNFRSSIPSLQPLEDINLDILQLKPLSADMPTLPRLNLNSFKTRLALPKSLELKPVLLESSVGNKKGVIGATLTLGSGKGLDRSNLLQQASESLKSSNILGQSLGTLPSLDDLHETLWENTQNLLSTPLETTGRNVVEDTLRSSQVLTDNLRVKAENAMKDIQENLASTLRGAGLHSPGGLGSFRSSSDLLEEITRRHEDVNDKLKGIHVDLSDRLESLRDNILDQYRIPSLGSSILGSSGLSSLGSALPKQSSTFRTYTKPSQNTLKSSKGKFVIPATKRKTSSRTSTDKNKLKTASSIATPKAIELPKLRAAPAESVLKTLRKESTLKTPQFLSRESPTLGILQPDKNLIDFDRPLLKKPRLGQSRVKISFSTTPRPQTLRNKPSFRADSKLRAKPLSLKDLPTLSRTASKDKKGLGSKLSFKDASGFASEVIPTKVKAPLGLPSSLRTATVDSDRNILNTISTTTLKPAITFPLTRPKSSLGTISSSDIDRPALLKSKSLIPDRTLPRTESVLRNSEISKTPALSWPKKLDDEFLTKVREALRARLAEIGKKSVKPITETKLGSVEPSTDDMARLASNAIEVTDPQMMKENTSYTCKMMCTKN